MRMGMLLLGLAVLVVAHASAQILPAEVGQMGLFGDISGADCNVVDGGGVLTIYAVHVNHEGAGAVDFMIEPGPGIVATWLSDTPVLGLKFGTSPTGISILYGSCQSAPTHVLTIQYMVQGLSDPCSEFTVVPNPNLPGNKVSTTLCSEEIRRETGIKNLVVNPDGLCDCIVPVQPATWGQIKSIYRNE